MMFVANLCASLLFGAMFVLFMYELIHGSGWSKIWYATLLGASVYLVLATLKFLPFV